MKFACAKFQGNQFIIDGEIDKKHALQIYQNECGPKYNAVVNVFPDPPHRGAAWGLPQGLPGGLLFVQAPGAGGFLNFCPKAGITGFVYIENHSDYSSDCYKMLV